MTIIVITFISIRMMIIIISIMIMTIIISILIPDHDHDHNEFAHVVGDSDALLDVDGDAFLFVDVLANLVEMILIMTNGVSDDYTDDQDVVDDDSNGDVDVLANLDGIKCCL